jgi:hypothetical protein
MQQLLLDFAALAAEAGASLVLSCREEIWRTLGQALRPDQEVPDSDIVLSNFDDAEVQEIVARVGWGLPAAAFSILKRPLFVRMLLDTRAAFEDRRVDLGRLFDAYLEAKAKVIAARFGIATSDVLDELCGCARWLLEHRVETMPVKRFLGTVSEAMAIALLEEGLCVRTKGEVAFESETLLEYLISLDLPDDPFETIDLTDRPPTDAWWGAAAFKATRLDPVRLQEVLEMLAQNWWSQEYVLSLVARSHDPSRYSSIVESLVGEKYFLFEALTRFLAEILDRRDATATMLVLRAVRAFIIGSFGSWREKDWAKTVPGQFDERLANGSGEQIGLLILRAHEVDPVVTFDTLIDWLADTAYLNDEEARVSDFASLFLRHLGCRDFRGIAGTLERFAERAPDTSYQTFNEITHILNFIGQHRRDVPLLTVTRWMDSDRQLLRLAATELFSAVPVADTAALMTAVQGYAHREDILDAERERAISAIGSRSSRAALNSLAALSEFEECQSGVISAYRQLMSDFPAEVLKRIAAFNGTIALRRDVIEALNGFYLGYLRAAPDAALAFFRRLQRDHPGRYARDIAHAIHALTEPIPVVTAFVEQQLPREQSGGALELYHYYLRKVRPMEDGDAPWVRRWIESGDGAYGLISYLLNGDLSYETKAELYHRLDALGPLYESDTYGLNERGTAFVRRFRGDPRFVSLTADGRVWVSEITNGHSSWDAARAVTEARVNELKARWHPERRAHE